MHPCLCYMAVQTPANLSIWNIHRKFSRATWSEAPLRTCFPVVGGDGMRLDTAIPGVTHIWSGFIRPDLLICAGRYQLEQTPKNSDAGADLRRFEYVLAWKKETQEGMTCKNSGDIVVARTLRFYFSRCNIDVKAGFIKMSKISVKVTPIRAERPDLCLHAALAVQGRMWYVQLYASSGWYGHDYRFGLSGGFL